MPRRDRRPLLAILLMCLRKLEVVFACVPKEDPLLAAVVKQSAKVQSQNENSEKLLTLANLRELHLRKGRPVSPPKRPEDSDSELEDEDSLGQKAEGLEHLWPVLSYQGCVGSLCLAWILRGLVRG
ncbi:hypothetical protein BDV19DRAFT_216516 [Aspergillus venezuelensis]